MEYYIVETGDLTVMKKIVNEHIDGGWEPIGGIAVKRMGHQSATDGVYINYNYLQAMTRTVS